MSNTVPFLPYYNISNTLPFLLYYNYPCEYFTLTVTVRLSHPYSPELSVDRRGTLLLIQSQDSPPRGYIIVTGRIYPPGRSLGGSIPGSSLGWIQHPLYSQHWHRIYPRLRLRLLVHDQYPSDHLLQNL